MCETVKKYLSKQVKTADIVLHIMYPY